MWNLKVSTHYIWTTSTVLTLDYLFDCSHLFNSVDLLN